MFTSKVIATALMSYLRFQRKHYLIATEVKYNKCRSDVLSVNDNKIYEFEVKVSKADLKKDFDKLLTVGFRSTRRKISKHALYNSKDPGSLFIPHYFSFVVPKSMVEYTLDLIKPYTNYGVISFDEDTLDWIKVEKPARALSKKPFNRRVADKILMRATSELTQMRVARDCPKMTVKDMEEASDEDVIVSFNSPKLDAPVTVVIQSEQLKLF